MSILRVPARPVLGVAAAALLVACGGDDICLNCNPDSTPTPGPTTSVTLEGDILRLSTLDPLSSVVIVTCVDPAAGVPLADCSDAFTTQADNEGNFTRSRITAGALALFFWIDRNEDGQVDPGDPYAVLQDPESRLADVTGGETVDIQAAQVDFATQTAVATIVLSRTPTPTPVPTATPAG